VTAAGAFLAAGALVLLAAAAGTFHRRDLG
jgi:hypothetical protein